MTWSERDHPRDGEGQFTDRPGDWADRLMAGVPDGVDRLKLAGRIELAPGERLLSSVKVEDDDGTVRIAVTDGPDGPAVRLGIGQSGYGSRAGGAESGEPVWAGVPADLGGIDAERAAVSEERDRLEAEWNADPIRRPEIERRLEELDEAPTGETYRTGATARVGIAAARQLQHQIGGPLGELTAYADRANEAWDLSEIETQRLEALRKPLKYMRRKWTDEEENLWDSLTEQIEQARPSDQTYLEHSGVVPGEWGDIHWQVELDDLAVGVTLRLVVQPHDEPDWDPDLAEERAYFDVAQARKLLKQLRASTG